MYDHVQSYFSHSKDRGKLSNKRDIVKEIIINRDYLRFLNVRISDIKHKYGKINIWNDKVLPL